MNSPEEIAVCPPAPIPSLSTCPTCHRGVVDFLTIMALVILLVRIPSRLCHPCPHLVDFQCERVTMVIHLLILDLRQVVVDSLISHRLIGHKNNKLIKGITLRQETQRYPNHEEKPNTNLLLRNPMFWRMILKSMGRSRRGNEHHANLQRLHRLRIPERIFEIIRENRRNRTIHSSPHVRILERVESGVLPVHRN